MDNTATSAASFVEKLTDPTHRWTPADYDCIPEGVHAEIYDGGIHVTPPSSTPGHQVASFDIAVILRQFVPNRRMVIEAVDTKTESGIFIPDVIVTREVVKDRPVSAKLVDIVVEIISAHENVERTAKKDVYEEAGIPAYIIVDGPDGKRFAEVYHLQDDRYELTKRIPASGMGSFTAPFTFAIDMTKINE